MAQEDLFKKLIAHCKEYGYVFPSSEIYGGINACWDYGPLGIELKRNVKERWWRAMCDREDIEGLDQIPSVEPDIKRGPCVGDFHFFPCITEILVKGGALQEIIFYRDFNALHPVARHR